MREAKPPTFENELESLINKYSIENGSDTPDFILAEYIMNCLCAFNKAVSDRTRWYRPDDDGYSVYCDTKALFTRTKIVKKYVDK